MSELSPLANANRRFPVKSVDNRMLCQMDQVNQENKFEFAFFYGYEHANQ